MQTFGVENLSFTYPGGRQLFSNLNWSVPFGTICSLLGRNGSGKTTLLHCATGITPGIKFVLPPRHSKKSLSTHYVLQEGTETLLPWKTVIDNISMPLIFNRIPREQCISYVNALIKKYTTFSKLKKYLSYYPYQLSGGFQQLVVLARAFVSQSSSYVFDEPFKGLDFKNKSEIRNLLLSFHRDCLNCTMVIVTQDIEEAILLSDLIFVLPQKEHPIKELRSIENCYPHPRAIDSKGTQEIRQKVYALLEEV